jgi:hypothetical protein
MRFFVVFAIALIAIGLALPIIGIREVPLWQVACGALIPAAAISFIKSE